jgi:hypothetical protein
MGDLEIGSPLFWVLAVVAFLTVAAAVIVVAGKWERGSRAFEVQPGATPRWNVLSISTPFVGFLCGALLGFGIESNSHATGRAFEVGVGTWVGFCVVGLLAGGMACGRRERVWGLTVLGLVLNGICGTVGLLLLLNS